MNLRGSKTEKNLFKTFAGECRSHTKYELYAEAAEKEGYMGIEKAFKEIASNELAHARKVYGKYLERINCTKNNLIEAAVSESEEAGVIYKDFERVAREEGFDDIADFFKMLQVIEESHKNKYLMLARALKDKNIFKDNEKTTWKCLNCGHVYKGKEAPLKCPLCRFSQGFFTKTCSPE